MADLGLHVLAPIEWEGATFEFEGTVVDRRRGEVLVGFDVRSSLGSEDIESEFRWLPEAAVVPA